MPAEFSFSTLTLDVNGQGVITSPPLTQKPSATGIQVAIDDAWLKKQPASSFPMYIDPSFSRDSTSYWMFKSDGYSCGANNCYANIGTINDASGYWRHWRTYVKFPLPEN